MMLPEEKELVRLEAEQADVTEQLRLARAAMEAIQAGTVRFHHRFRQAVGRLYAELDEINVHIAIAKMEQSPDDENLKMQARAAEEQAQRSIQEAGLQQAGSREDGLIEDQKPFPVIGVELKRAYRNAVKLMHPDLASLDSERQRRTRLMALVNIAYRRGDHRIVEKLVEEFGQDPDAIVGADIGSVIVKAIRRIAQLNRRLVEVQQEAEAWQSTEIFRLRQIVESAEATGADPLGDLAHQLKQKILERHGVLKAVRPAQRVLPIRGDDIETVSLG
jgi:hypothetical protein